MRASWHWRKGFLCQLAYFLHRILINRLTRIWIIINLRLKNAGKAIRNNHKSQIGFLWCILHAKELEYNIIKSDSERWRDGGIGNCSWRVLVSLLPQNTFSKLVHSSWVKVWDPQMCPSFRHLQLDKKNTREVKWSRDHYRPWFWLKKAIESASRAPEDQRLPFEDSLLGGRGSMRTFFLGWGCSARCSQTPRQLCKPGAGVWTGESPQCGMAWLLALILGAGWLKGLWFWIQLLQTGREFNPKLVLVLEDLTGCYSNLVPCGKRQTPPKSVLWPTAWWQQRVPIRQEKSSRGWYPLEFIWFVLSGQHEGEGSDRRVGPAAFSRISEILA